MENIYKDIPGFDMTYDESKDICREAWKDEDCEIFLQVRLIKKNEAEQWFCNEINQEK